MKKFTAVLLSVLLLASSLPMSTLAAETPESLEPIVAEETSTEETTPKAETTAATEAVDATSEKQTEAPSATVPKETVEPVGAQAESQIVGENSFTYTISDNQVTITGLNDQTITDLVIPDTIEDLPVTAIKAGAFNGCSQIKSITVPNTVTSIGKSAFKGTNPTKVSLPFVGKSKTAYSDWERVFGYVFGFIIDNTYILSDATTQYYYYPDHGNASFYHYYIPKTIKEVIITEAKVIPKNAFCNCSWIESIKSNQATIIGDSAFSDCSSLSIVEIPDTLDTIGSHAFDNCSALKNVDFPDSLKTIDSYAFNNCSALASVEFPDSLETIGTYAFNNCSALTSIELPDSLETIGTYAFKDCSAIKSVQLSDNLSVLSGGLFSGCQSLKNINFPANLTEIGSATFYGCVSLEKTDLVIPDGVTSIGNGAFSNCCLITSITVPNSVTTIGSGAFYGTNPSKISLPFIGSSRTVSNEIEGVFGYIFGYEAQRTTDSLGTFQSSYYVPYVGDYYCYYFIPKTIKEVTITDATQVPKRAFYNCSWIEKLTINDIKGDESLVGPSAFASCEEMTVYINRDTAVHTYCERYGIRHCSTKSLTLESNSLTLFRNETGTIGSEVILLNDRVDDNPETVWTSSDPDVASVDRYTGVISAVAPGTATITADSEGVTANAEVTVYFKLEGITLNKTTTEIDIDIDMDFIR